MLTRLVVSTLIILTAFSAGIAFGVYYHAELLVYWRVLVLAPRATNPPAPVSPPPATDTTAHNSALTFDQLPEPLPLVYSDTLEEERLQQYLKEGAVVLPLGTSFGEPGNVVVTAHSSGTAAFGPYRFAFAKLGELEAGQQFNISTPTATYTYQVYGKEIVWPHEVNKLPNDSRSTVTLVTCWPLWTNFKRLLVHAELVDTAQNR
ncbi:MAG: sortase [Candidatus Andersenbacteria bacterium]|nr:sortase [Candidatus Andersenbacteria bacterium]